MLIFYYSQPKDTVVNFKIEALTDSTLVFGNKMSNYRFAPKVEGQKTIQTQDKIKPSEGISVNSVWRGALGMFSLIFIAFLFSSNKRAINWKTVGIGLVLQLVIAIGVLKVPFIQKAFEFVGRMFIEILEFTRAGSKFLFEGLVDNMDTFGFIFAFQVLPTIIFFSALTSLLFYLVVFKK